MLDPVSNADKMLWDIIKRWGKVVAFLIMAGGALALLRSDVSALKEASVEHESRLNNFDRRAARDDEWRESVKQSLERIERAIERKQR